MELRLLTYIIRMQNIYRVVDEEARKCTCKKTMWRFQLTIVAVETQQCVLWLLLVHVTVNNITILSVTQNRFYG